MFPLPAPTSDVAALLARIVLGVVLVAHGWQKLVDNGIGATTEGFTGMGIPLAGVAAVFATAVELGGGLLIIAGAATQVVGALVVLNMLGAGWFAGHFTSGVFAAQGGWELVGVIAAAALLLVAFGPGRFSVDRALTARRRTAQLA